MLCATLALFIAPLVQDSTPVEVISTRRPAAAAEQDPADPPRCRVLGRVLGAQGEPVSGAKAWLHTVGEPWRAGATGPNGKTLPGEYETKTAADGRFEFDVVLPTSSWVALVIEPGPYLAKSGRTFGLAGGRNRDPLFEGNNQLGDFTLMTTGAIAGHVLGPGGTPLLEARASLDGSFPGGFTAMDLTDSSGAFLIGHVPPGSYRLSISGDGCESTVTGAVEVRATRTSSAPRIELVEAATVTGRVVDEQGRPIAGARLRGEPTASGRHANGETGADGRFRIHLPNRMPYKFAVHADGYRSVDDQGGDPEVLMQPGAEDAVITLVTASLVTFRVLDARTDQPLESYGLRIDPAPDENFSSSSTEDSIPPRTAPGGQRTVAAEPALHVVRLEAPGYAPTTRKITFDEGAGATQTIRLTPASRVTGVIRHGAEPAARATVHLEAAIVKLDPSLPDEFGDDWFFSDNYGPNLDEFMGRPRVATTDAGGRFAFEDLAAGTYQLKANATEGAPFELDGLVVGEAAAVELGALELPIPGAVLGRVLTPASVPAAGLEVYLDGPFDEVVSRVAADGTFRFDGLKAGEHELTIEAAAGVLARQLVTPFKVAAGATCEVTLDLLPHQPVRVRLTVELNGKRLPDLIVSHGHGSGSRAQPSGRTDPKGELTFELEPGPDVQLTVGSPAGMHLGTISLEGASFAGAEIEHLAQLEAGHWAVEFPAGFVLPEPGKANLLITPIPGEPHERKYLSLDTPTLEFRTGLEWTEPRRELGPIAPGIYRLDVRVSEYGQTPQGHAAFLVYAEPMTATFEVRAGELATALLAPME